MWDKKGVLPDALTALTPRQFATLFSKRPDVRLDRVAELRRHNDDRGRRGLKPTVPAWMIDPAG